MKYNLNLFGRIVIAGILAFFIHSYILMLIASNYIFLVLRNIIITILSLGIVFAIFMLIQLTGHARFLNKKNVNIFCIIFAAFIILPAVIEYYNTVPPAEITNSWACPEGQKLCAEIAVMNLGYDYTQGLKQGSLIKNGKIIGGFIWKYDRLSKEITLYQPQSWEIKLRLEITGDKGNRKMTTNYISSNGKTPFDAELFNGVTLTATQPEY